MALRALSTAAPSTSVAASLSTGIDDPSSSPDILSTGVSSLSSCLRITRHAVARLAAFGHDGVQPLQPCFWQQQVSSLRGKGAGGSEVRSDCLEALARGTEPMPMYFIKYSPGVGGGGSSSLRGKVVARSCFETAATTGGGHGGGSDESSSDSEPSESELSSRPSACNRCRQHSYADLEPKTSGTPCATCCSTPSARR